MNRDTNTDPEKREFLLYAAGVVQWLSLALVNNWRIAAQAGREREVFHDTFSAFAEQKMPTVERHCAGYHAQSEGNCFYFQCIPGCDTKEDGITPEQRLEDFKNSENWGTSHYDYSQFSQYESYSHFLHDPNTVLEYYYKNRITAPEFFLQ